MFTVETNAMLPADATSASSTTPTAVVFSSIAGALSEPFCIVVEVAV